MGWQLPLSGTDSKRKFLGKSELHNGRIVTGCCHPLVQCITLFQCTSRRKVATKEQALSFLRVYTQLSFYLLCLSTFHISTVLFVSWWASFSYPQQKLPRGLVDLRAQFPSFVPPFRNIHAISYFIVFIVRSCISHSTRCQYIRRLPGTQPPRITKVAREKIIDLSTTQNCEMLISNNLS